MKVEVTEECIACEVCVGICPDVFQMGDEFAEVQCDEVPSELEDDVIDAADACPVDAIIVQQ